MTSDNEKVSSKDLGLGDMFRVNFMVDCKFIVGPVSKKPETIFGHKWMFAVESQVFERMFCGDFMEAKNSTEIHLPDDDPIAFRNMRRLIYNSRASNMSPLSFDDTISLYKLCDKYMVESISKLCSDHLKSLLNETTISQLIQLFAAARDYRDNSLLEEVKKILHRTQYPLASDIYNLTEINFMEYIKLYEEYPIHDNHLVLFEAIEQYLTDHNLIPKTLLDAEEINSKTTKDDKIEKSEEESSDKYGMETENRKSELLDRLLSIVDFGKMNIDLFLTHPGTSKILNWQQKFFILSQLSAQPCKRCGSPDKIKIKLFNTESVE